MTAPPDEDVLALLAEGAVYAEDAPGGLDEASALVVIRRLYREGVVNIALAAD